jgi:hypothetical protein
MLEGVLARTSSIKHRLGTTLGEYWLTRYYAGFSDVNYYLPSINEMKLFIDSHPITSNIYLGEGFDCDDYTFVFKGNMSLFTRDHLQLKASVCVGIAWGLFSWRPEYHAVNWFLDKDSVFWWIEPQDGRIYPLDECKRKSLELLIV